MAGKFELFCGCFGNGTTVCNKAVTENGDYKKIAHISEGGNIRLYVAESYIPADEMDEIGYIQGYAILIIRTACSS